MANVFLPSETWVDLYAATGFVVGTQLTVTLVTSSNVRLSSTQNEPLPDSEHIVMTFPANPAKNEDGDLGAWALCVGFGGGAIDVREV